MKVKPPIYVNIFTEVPFCHLVVPTIDKNSNEDFQLGLWLTGELSANEELLAASFCCFGGFVFLVVLRAFISSYLESQNSATNCLEWLCVLWTLNCFGLYCF